MGPVLAEAGAGIAAIFLAKMVSPVVKRSKTGTRAGVKKWRPMTGKEPTPGTVKGARLVAEGVKGMVTASAGMESTERGEAISRAVRSKSVARAPAETGAAEALVGQV